MLHCHVSQMYEWLPYNMNTVDQVPAGQGRTPAWMATLWLPAMAKEAERCRPLLRRLYGEEAGDRVQYAEALEFCEYGSKVTPEVFARLFPFFG